MVESVGIHINKLEASHFAHFPALNSAWDTLLNPETGQVSEIKTRNPQTKVLARPYVRDQDYHALYLQGNPTEAGQWAANVVFSQRGRNPNADAWIVLNEPPCDTVEQVERLAQADIAYMKALEAQGLKAGIGAFSTGNLQIPRFDNARQVRAYEPAFRYAAEKGHYLVLHCYAAARPMMGGTAPSGWVHDPRYFGLRWHEEIFPYMRANGIPIPKTIIAEFGLDLGFAKKFAGYTGQYVGYRVAEPWGYGDSEAGARQYVDDLAPFAAELVKDSEVEGICIYCAGDNGDEKWRSFMVDGAMGYLASKAFPFPTQPQQPPATPPVPVPPTGGTLTLTDRFIQLATAKWGNRFGDLRATLPKHATLKFRAIDSRLMQYICFHHTATAINATWKRIAEAHIAVDPARNKEEWAGIGYHIGVRQGKIALLADLDTQRAHVKGRNHEALGVVWMGNSDTVPVPSGDQQLLKEIVEVLDALYTRDKELTWHGKMLTNYTECPGSSMKQIVPTLRATVPVPPPLAYTDDERAKAKWYVEQMARTLRGDPDATATLISALISEPKKVGLHNVLVARALPSLERA